MQAVQAILPAAPSRDLLVRNRRRAEQRGPLCLHRSPDDVEAFQVPQEHDTEPAAQRQQGGRRERQPRQGRHGQLRANGRRRRPHEGKQRQRVQPAPQHMAATEGAPGARGVGPSRLAVRALLASVSI